MYEITITTTPAQATITVTSPAAPTTQTGWRMQAQRRVVGTTTWVSHGSADTAAPWTRGATVPVGLYEIRVVWSRTGSPTQTSAVATIDARAGNATVVIPEDVVVPPPPPPPPDPPPTSGLPSGAVQIATEGQTVPITGTQLIYYGAQGQYITKSFTGSVVCTNAGVGSDPFPGVPKFCYLVPGGGTPDPPPPPPPPPGGGDPPPPPPPAPVNCEWSAWSDWSAWTPNGDGTESQTRTRTILVQAANGGTPCTGASSERNTRPIVTTPPPPPTGGTRTRLTPSDLSYVGKILLPDDDPGGTGVRMGYSRGTITGRRVNGELRLFITGAVGGNGDYHNEKDAVYEVRSAGVGQRATVVRNWRDVTKGRSLILQDTQQEPCLNGLYFLAGRLWWAYGSNYMTSSQADPSLGCAILNDTTGAVAAYGPWRTTEHSQKTRGYLVAVPADIAGGRPLAVGGPVWSQNGFGPRGAVLVAPEVFDPTTRPANTASDFNGAKLSVQRLVYHDHDHPQARNGNYKACGWNSGYSGPGWTRAGDPTFNNSDGGDVALDQIGGAAWVRTATKEGVIFVGQITDIVAGVNYHGDTVPHLWYGPQNTPCPHGHTSSIPGAGPKSSSEAPVLWIYDAAQLAQAAAGAVLPWSFPAAAEVKLNAISGSQVAALVTEQKNFGGAWFDATDNRLYISQTNVEVRGEPRPVIHVFQVS